MSFEIYPEDFSTRYELKHAISVIMSIYYNDIGKLILAAPINDYNIIALKVGNLLYDTTRNVTYYIVDTKTDTTTNRITANGYTANWFLNKRVIAEEYVSSFTNSKGIGTVSVEADCEPYKYKVDKTTVTRAVSGEDSIVLANSRKRAVPEVVIATESTIRIAYQSNIWDLGSGSYTLPELELTAGENTVTVTGTGSVSFTWQEASL